LVTEEVSPMNQVEHAPPERDTAPPLPLFDVMAFATLTLLALAERFGDLTGATAALASARYVLRI
jgi:hypothetical protein